MNVSDEEFAMLDEVVSSIYKRGLEDAWECARKLILSCGEGGYDAGTIKDVFGMSYHDVLKECKPSKVIEIFKEYEQQKYAVKCENCAKAISTECVVDGCEFEPKQDDATDNDEIKVGDEVICYGTDTRKVVFEVIEISDFTKNESGNKQKKYCCFGNTGISTELDGAYKPKKTGRHFDAITEVLEQLRGEE